MSTERETIQSARARVEITASRRPGTRQQACIDERRKTSDSGSLDRNDKGTRGSVLVLQVEAWVIGGDNKTDDERSKDIEQENADIDALDGPWDVASYEDIV